MLYLCDLFFIMIMNFKLVKDNFILFDLAMFYST